MGECREVAAFGVRQAQPTATKLRFEDRIFFLQIGDDLLLATLEPASERGDEHMQDHGVSLGWKP